jgi:hypothetical protein
MSEDRPAYLQRLNYRPKPDELTVAEADWVRNHFEVAANELVVNGRQVVNWQWIEEVEVAKAARIRGPAGWFLRFVAYENRERYHVGIYYGANEAVLTNVSREVAQYIVQTIAYYVPQRVRYTGPHDITPLDYEE